MDPEESHLEGENGMEKEASPRRILPYDLPRSLDDRQPVRELGVETEMYDAWQGMVWASHQPIKF